jgi:c-di-GMP-binding flagellar brake protein YcgR
MMDFVDRRRFTRYALYCPIEYRCEDGSPIDSSVTLNLSEGGAFVTANRFLPISTRLIIKMSLKGQPFFVRARVIHVKSDHGSDSYSVGVEFLQSPFNFVRKFYEQLETIMLFQREYSMEAGRPVTLAEASMKWYSAPETN